MKELSRKKAWSRWLHRTCGVPAEHVAHVLGFTPIEVEALASLEISRISRDELEYRRRLRQNGPTYAQIATDRGRTAAAIHKSLALSRKLAKTPTGPPRAQQPKALLSQLGTYARSFRDLGYSATRIAELLALEPSMVEDFLRRLEPLRRPRKNPNRLDRPREHRQEQTARLTLQRAEERRLRRAEQRRQRREDERIARLQLHRSPEDAWGPRRTSAEIADYARFLDAVRDGRLSGPELLGLASRLYHAEPRNRPPEPEPVVWTGDTGLGVGGQMKLTAQQILAAADLLRSGATWAHVAQCFEVSENTLRRYVNGIAPRRAAAEYPTEAARYPHGIVRWDLPLGTTSDGTHRTVLVQCECGRERRVWTSEITRPKTQFTGMCYACFRPIFLQGRQSRRPPVIATPPRQPAPRPLCACGCGTPVKRKDATFLPGHRPARPARPLDLCACGCGRTVNKPGRRFVHGHNGSKLTAADAREARRLRETGMSVREIAGLFGMTEMGMYSILCGRRRVLDDVGTPSLLNLGPPLLILGLHDDA